VLPGQLIRALFGKDPSISHSLLPFFPLFYLYMHAIWLFIVFIWNLEKCYLYIILSIPAASITEMALLIKIANIMREGEREKHLIFEFEVKIRLKFFLLIYIILYSCFDTTQTRHVTFKAGNFWHDPRTSWDKARKFDGQGLMAIFFFLIGINKLNFYFFTLYF